MSTSAQIEEPASSLTTSPERTAALPDCSNEYLRPLLPYLRRLNLQLYRQMTRIETRNRGSPPLESHGLYTSSQEAAAILGELLDGERQVPDDAADQEIALLDSEIRSASTESRVGHLRSKFSLSPEDVSCLIVCFAPEIDRRYGRLYGFLQDDITREVPTIGFLVDLVPGWTYPSFLSSNLVRDGLVAVVGAADTPLASRSIRLDQRITLYLLGSDLPDTRLASCVSIQSDTLHWAELIIDSAVVGAAQRVTERWNARTSCAFQGPPGCGKRAVAAAMAASLGRRLIVLDANRLPEHISPQEAARAIGREAALQGAVVLCRGVDDLCSGPDNDPWSMVVAELADSGGPIIFSGERVWDLLTRLGIRATLIEFPPLNAQHRRALWERAFVANNVEAVTVENVHEISEMFRLDGHQIKAAAASASGLARMDGTEVSAGHLRAACRLHSNRSLAQLAQRLESRYTWDDIVLPPDQMEQLRELRNCVAHRETVYGEWGFARKSSRGRGVNALFSGPSGTGKTMGAEVIAKELGLDIYKIDLSTVVDKYIGETEKKLDRIFREAETSNAILFFDEADALFGKRSEVRDSHDRYANIEIAYLLQKMEEYDGVVILATNLRKNLDEAFRRRIHFCIEFPFPDEDHRRRIWAKAFPAEAPVGSEVDLGMMAANFKVAGGSIKNIAVAAAFLAASDGRTITPDHLVRATRREYQKMGRLIVDREFGTQEEPVGV